MRVKKSFAFQQKSYLVAVRSEVTENGALAPHTLEWRGGFGDQSISNAASTEHAVYYDQSNSKLYEKDAKEAKNGPVSFSGQLSFDGIADQWIHSWGWTIILVTVVITMALFPLRISSMKSARKMQRLQPQIKAINEKYKNVKLNDPRKQEQNEELMALYKREGVNPVGGCLPMLIQLPFLYAFYRVLAVSISLRGAGWLWVHDLSQPETLPIRMLPVILIITQFLTQKMTPAPGVDPSQQKMMMFMPLVLGYMFYFLPSGLVLYYLTSNLVGILQQWMLNRGATPAPAAVDAKPAAKRKK